LKKAVLGILKANGYKINRENRKLYRSMYSELFNYNSIINKRFYNIGAGGFSHEFWTNIDYDSSWYSKNSKHTKMGISHDLMSLKELPIKDSVAEVLYTSHTIEHITNKACIKLFSECYRILKQGGFLRITAPNIDLSYRAFADNDINYYYWASNYRNKRRYKQTNSQKHTKDFSIEQLFLSHFATNISEYGMNREGYHMSDDEFRNTFIELEYEAALDHITSKCSLEKQKALPGEHINWWNNDKLIAFLKNAGFTNVYLSGYGQSYCPILRDTSQFDSTHPKLSLYVEAIK